MRFTLAALLSTLIACGRTQVFDESHGVSANGAPTSITTVIETGSAWRITNASPSADWSRAVDFDDSAWSLAVVIIPRGVTPAQSGDSIWDIGPTTRSGSQEVWMRRRFILRGTVDSGTLEFACNDDMEVWLNGAKVITDTDGVTTFRALSDVGAMLVVGQNLVAARCADRIAPDHAFWGVLTATTH